MKFFAMVCMVYVIVSLGTLMVVYDRSPNWRSGILLWVHFALHNLEWKRVDFLLGMYPGCARAFLLDSKPSVPPRFSEISEAEFQRSQQILSAYLMARGIAKRPIRQRPVPQWLLKFRDYVSNPARYPNLMKQEPAPAQ